MRAYLDLETESIADDNRLPRPVVMGVTFGEADSPIQVVQGTRNVIATAEELLALGFELWAHNGAHFDFPVLGFWSEASGLGGQSLWADAAHADKLVCTSIVAHLNDIATRGVVMKDLYPLVRVCRDYGIAVTLDKENPWRTRYAELEHVPLGLWPAEARAYLESDVRALHGLGMHPRFATPPADTHRKTEQHYWLELSSFNGAPTHKGRAIAWGAELRARAKDLESELFKAKLIDADGKKNAKAAKLAICGIDTSELSLDEIDILDKDVTANPPAGVRKTKPSKKFPEGQVSVDAIACEDSDAPLMILLAEYNGITGTISRELPTVMMGRVHTRYGLKSTGRTSSAKPALQNLGNATGARACFIADPGMHLAIGDWSLLELCCLGHICVELQCGSGLAEALREGRDLHAELAQDLAAAGGFGDDPKRLRRLAKEANFGRGGGMGADTLIRTARKRGLVFDLPTSKALIAIHAKRRPEIVQYHRKVQAHLDYSDSMTAYRTGMVRGNCNFTQAANTLFQTLGANVALEGFVAVSRAGYVPQLFVHDEYHWSLNDPGETETIRDILMKVSRDWLHHCPSKIDPVIVQDWSQKK